MRYGKAESNVYIQGNVEAAEHRERAVIQRAEVPFSWAYSVSEVVKEDQTWEKMEKHW